MVKTKVGLSQKPEREIANKIIVSNDRVYAKSQKKDKSKKQPKDTQKESAKKDESADKSSKWVEVTKGKKASVKNSIGEKVVNQEVKKKPKPRNGYAYKQHQFYNPWFNYQMPFHNVSVPPPEITMPQPHPPQNGTGNIQMSSGVKPPQNPFFHWGTPKNRWKNLNPNTPL